MSDTSQTTPVAHTPWTPRAWAVAWLGSAALAWLGLATGDARWGPVDATGHEGWLSLPASLALSAALVAVTGAWLGRVGSVGEAARALGAAGLCGGMLPWATPLGVRAARVLTVSPETLDEVAATWWVGPVLFSGVAGTVAAAVVCGVLCSGIAALFAGAAHAAVPREVSSRWSPAGALLRDTALGLLGAPLAVAASVPFLAAAVAVLATLYGGLRILVGSGPAGLFEPISGDLTFWSFADMPTFALLWGIPVAVVVRAAWSAGRLVRAMRRPTARGLRWPGWLLASLGLLLILGDGVGRLAVLTVQLGTTLGGDTLPSLGAVFGTIGAVAGVVALGLVAAGSRWPVSPWEAHPPRSAELFGAVCALGVVGGGTALALVLTGLTMSMETVPVLAALADLAPAAGVGTTAAVVDRLGIALWFGTLGRPVMVFSLPVWLGYLAWRRWGPRWLARRAGDGLPAAPDDPWAPPGEP